MKHVILFITLVLMPGCASTPTRAPRTALIGHIVFIDLREPSDSDAVIRDSDEMLSTIPTVSTFAVGRHIDTGRDTVINDYDVAIYLGFESAEDLAAYVAHEQHVAYVNKWLPRTESLRVYDMYDPSE